MEVIEHKWSWRYPLVPRLASARKVVVLHHAAAREASPETVDKWHKGNGWAGIGYHFYVRKDGRVHRGRPYWAKGAHCPNANSHTGICLEGDFTVENPTTAQVSSLKALLAELQRQEGALRLTRHRDWKPTACPGQHFPWPLEVADVPRPSKPAPKAMPLVKRGDKGAAVKTLQLALKSRGYRIEADGVFGKQTEATVKTYQKRCGMKADGIVGRKTWAALGYAFKE